MKAFPSLAALALSLLLSSCSLTQQQTQDDAPGTPEARTLTERPGNIFSTRSRRVHTTQETPAASVENQTPATENTEEQPTTTSSTSSTPSTPSTPSTAPVPTVEQQQAAEAILTGNAVAPPAPTAAPAPIPTPAPAEDSAPLAPLPSGGLRMGTIVPQEDPASATDAPPPGANAVERRGLRSPRLPGSLPMGIDGKVTPQN